MTRLIVFCAVGLSLGCVATTHSQGSELTTAALSTDNFRVVTSGVLGTSKGVRVLGMGSSATYAEAMAELRKKANLTAGSRALVNITEDIDRQFLPVLFQNSKVTLTADVVEFSTGAPTLTPERLLRLFTSFFNTRRAGPRDGLSPLLDPDVELYFVGRPFGPIRGRDELLNRLADVPISEGIGLLHVRETTLGAFASYSFSQNPESLAGEISCVVESGVIKRIDLEVFSAKKH